MRRHELTEREWRLIEPHTLGRAGTAGGTGRDNQLFVNAVVWRVRTGVPWRDLPEGFGNWNSIARRFRRWAQAGALLGGTAAVDSSPDFGTHIRLRIPLPLFS